MTTVAPPAESVVVALPLANTPLVADNSLAAGGEVSVTFSGFVPGEFVQLIVASTPQVIGSGYANAQGVVTLTGNIPAGLAAGSHTLAVYAPVSGIGFKQPISVEALTLPATGSSHRGLGAGWTADASRVRPERDLLGQRAAAFLGYGRQHHVDRPVARKLGRQVRGDRRLRRRPDSA